MELAQPILVTGATGFIGRRLVARLLERGLAVRALVLPEDGLPLDARVEVLRGSIASAVDVERAVRGAATVMHLAAVVGDWGDPATFRAVTVEGTRHVLQAAAAGTRVIQASSVVVYGDAIGRDVCDEEHPFGMPQGHYSRSKQDQEWLGFELAAETAAASGRAYNVCDGSDVTWRRYFGDLARIARSRPPRSIPGFAARISAQLCEATWTALSWPGRPPLTREALNLVGSHHRIPIGRAVRELRFSPHVSYSAALEEIARSIGG